MLQLGVTYLWTAWIGGRPLPATRSILSPEEAARAERFVFDRDRNRFVAGRGALRSLLAHYQGVEPREVVLEYSHYGKPFLPRELGRDQLEFNLSHSDDWALIGITLGRRLGVDLERLRVLDDLEGLARTVFSRRELAELAEVPEPERTEAFFNCWTRKEAFIKACG
ncbi:MAG: 4'-phosphopantetheinyl transferase superfamily protein, partial [Actinomycetota bacterium]